MKLAKIKNYATNTITLSNDRFIIEESTSGDVSNIKLLFNGELIVEIKSAGDHINIDLGESK